MRWIGTQHLSEFHMFVGSENCFSNGILGKLGIQGIYGAFRKCKILAGMIRDRVFWRIN